MTVSRKLTILAAVLVLLALAVSASADWTKTSYLTGSLATGQGLECDAAVSLLGNVYTYHYTLIYTAGAAPIHTYKVYNPSGSAFFGATNTDGFSPLVNGSDSVLQWLNGNVAVGQTCTFSYQSHYAPMDIDVYTIAVDTGKSATGKTLGMGTTIPEPSSLAALLFGAVWLVPMAIRRRK